MSQDDQLLKALTALKNGDFSVRLSSEPGGVSQEIAQTFNEMMDQLNTLTLEVIRVANEVGLEGRFGPQAEVDGVTGRWREIRDHVNLMSHALTAQIRNFAGVCDKLAKGEPTGPATVAANGETAEFKALINRLIESYGTVQQKI